MSPFLMPADFYGPLNTGSFLKIFLFVCLSPQKSRDGYGTPQNKFNILNRYIFF